MLVVKSHATDGSTRTEHRRVCWELFIFAIIIYLRSVKIFADGKSLRKKKATLSKKIFEKKNESARKTIHFQDFRQEPKDWSRSVTMVIELPPLLQNYQEIPVT